MDTRYSKDFIQKGEMKVRKKIYPLAITISLPLVFIIFYLINQGHFEQLSHSSVSSDLAKENKVLYLGYDLSWKGIGKPKIKDMHFINKDRKSTRLNSVTW